MVQKFIATMTSTATGFRIDYEPYLVDGPIPTPTTPEPPAIPEPPPPSGDIMPMPGNGVSTLHNGGYGEVKTYQIPVTMTMAGQVEIGSHPNTPTEMDAEMVISTLPGDMDSWRNHPVSAPRDPTAVAFPYRAIGGASQGLSIRWGPHGSFDRAQITSGLWYLNIRFVNNSGVVSFKYNQQ